MKNLMRSITPSGSMAVALVALLVAMSGSAVAASLITSKQIKDGTIQTKDLSKKARVALNGARGSAGPQGLPGPQGPKGDTGAAGAAGKDGAPGKDGLISSATVQRKEFATLADGATGTETVTCPAGQKAIGGGVRSDGYGIGLVESSRPTIGDNGMPGDGDSFDGWRATVVNPPDVGGASITPSVWVICAH
jgi:hypothetical protein